MPLFSEAAEVLTSACTEISSVPGSYVIFGTSTAIALQCWEGRTENTSTSGNQDTENEHIDWMFGKTSLVVDSVQQSPSRGDRLTVAGVEYEVLPIRDGEPAYELSGINRSWFRVHTKKR